MSKVKEAILTALCSPESLTPAQRAFVGTYLPGCPACEARRDAEMNRDRDVELGRAEAPPYEPTPEDAAWWAEQTRD